MTTSSENVLSIDLPVAGRLVVVTGHGPQALAGIPLTHRAVDGRPA